MSEHDVEVACRPELAAEPGELLAEPFDPALIEHGRGGLQNGTEAARGHAELVEVPWARPEPNAGVVCEEPRVLLAEEAAEKLQLRSGSGRLERGLDCEGPREPRLRLCASRAGLAQDLLDARELFAIRGERLDLDLLQLAHDSPAVEDRDRRHGHLGQRVPALPDADAARPRAQARNRPELETSRRGRDELLQLGRWCSRPADGLDVEPCTVTRHRQLPRSFSVLDAAAQCEADPGEALVCGIEVRLRVDARGQRSTGEAGEVELLTGDELDVSLGHGVAS